MLSSFLLLLGLTASTTAKLLSMMRFATASATLDLGGASTSSSSGMIYRIDDGEWKEIHSEGDKDPCYGECDGGSYTTWDIPELNNNVVRLCSKDMEHNDCVPGDDYTCQWTYGDIVVEYRSASDTEGYGLGYQLGPFCGGPLVNVDL